jgi:hypothetical protein
MVAEFQIGDRVRLKNGASDLDAGIVVQRHLACVFAVQGTEGMIRYYSGQQLELVETGDERTRGNPSYSRKRGDVCN